MAGVLIADVCTAPLTTSPMSEANGPACGVPHQRQGGYLVVVQFLAFDRWDEFAAAGLPIEGLRLPVVAVATWPTLYMRDEKRRVVVSLTGADSSTDTMSALVRFAERLYPAVPSPTTVPAHFEALPLGGPGCRPVSPRVGSEIRGSAGTGELYGLVFVDGLIRTGTEVKIVWRMTGHGELQATAIGPTGQNAPLVSGPTAHTGSSFERPGDEWGVFYRFDQPGCWQLHISRNDFEGDAWIEVAAS